MKKRKNIVYSTDENFSFENEKSESIEEIPNEKQNLKCLLKRIPGNRILTVVTGMKGNDQLLIKILQMHGINGQRKQDIKLFLEISLQVMYV